MKKKILIGVLILLGACNQPVKGKHGDVYKTPADYNNYIIDRQKKVGLYVTWFYRVLQTNHDSAALVLTKGLGHVNRSLGEIKDMPVYHGDSSFRFAAINSFDFYKRLFETDYPLILSLYLPKDGISAAGVAEEAEIVKRIIRDEYKVDKDLHNRQRDFADRFSMPLNKADN